LNNLSHTILIQMKFQTQTFFSVLIGLAHHVSGHGYMKSPRARNYIAYQDGVWWGGGDTDPQKESCPHCLNLGGSLARCGITGGRNYDYPKNHNGGDLAWSTQATYAAGSIIEIDTVLTAHHKGHIEVKACPVSNPGEVATQACFDAHPLEFISDQLYGAPVDPNYPGRAYLAPLSMTQTDSSGVNGKAYKFKFKVPNNISGNVLFQWWYLTGNSCTGQGYDEYNFPSGWKPSASECANIPEDGNGVPEQFWNCAEVYITDSGPVGSPEAAPSPNPPNPVISPIAAPSPNPPNPVVSPVAAPSQNPPTNQVHEDDSRLIAYLGNWQSCPTMAQVAQYTHIVIAFAVSYTWSPAKNNCSPTCAITEPPICNNAPNPALVSQWKAAGKKVILSFGGAGMGGSWAGDNNDCWENCYGRETQVTDRLVEIVTNMNLDGVDIDFEYHVTPAAVTFLNEVTTGLKNNLPSGSEITHAPMDSDVIPGQPYYDDVLMVTGHKLDFLMPQYYNGVTRPALDGVDGTGNGGMSALSHYTTIVDGIFGGDARRMVFGFCISDCSGTGSNASGAQASTVMTDLAKTYPCNGGGFFWVVQHDTGGSWSMPVSSTINNLSSTGCSSLPTKAPTPSTPQPTVNPNATPNPTPQPTQAPVPAPTTPSSKCCLPNETKMKAYNGCTQYYRCVWGEVQSGLIGPMANGALFDEGIQNWNWPANFQCSVDQCGGPSPPKATSQPTQAPVVSPPTTSVPAPSPPNATSQPTQAPVPAPTTSGPSSKCCLPNENKMKAYNGCTQYYRCVWGEVQSGLIGPMSNGALFDEGIQNWNWPANFQCSVDQCGGPDPITQAPVPAPTTSGPSSKCCLPNENKMKAYNGCTQYYRCVWGEVQSGLIGPMSNGALFDEGIQNWNWPANFQCFVDNCGRRLRGRSIE